MTQETTNIKSFLSYVDPSRKSLWIEGQHPLLGLWANWYKGNDNWHYYWARQGRTRVQLKRKSSGISKMICNEWACNYANDTTKISVAKEGQDDIIKSILNKNQTMAKFGGFIEKTFALGMGATVVMPSTFVTDENGIIVKDSNFNKSQVKIFMLNAKRVIPVTVEDGEITECAFIRYATNKCYLQLHIKDERGYYNIYETSGTANKASGQGFNFNFANTIHIATHSAQPLFQIWHPVVEDNKNICNELPCSIYIDAIDWFKTLDMQVDTFYTEFKNGRKKMLISGDLQYIDADGQVANVPLEEDTIYVPPGTDAKSQVQEFNGDLRIDAMVKGINFSLNMISTLCGLGDNKFEFDGTTGTVQTATGVVAKQSALYKNVIKQENLATDRFKKMLMAIQYVNNEFTANPALNFEENDITIEYDDNLIEDTETLKQQEMTEVNAGLMSIIEFRQHWYDEDEDTAIKNAQLNGLLFNQYLVPLQAGAITPELFVSRVYGDNVENKEELIAYIKKRYEPQIEDDYNDESEPEEDEEGGADE